MILCNTTFHVEKSADEMFHSWVRNIFLPVAEQGGMSDKLFSRIYTDDEDAACYAIQFKATDMDHVNQWMVEHGEKVLAEVVTKYENRVLPFTTLMEIL